MNEQDPVATVEPSATQPEAKQPEILREPTLKIRTALKAGYNASLNYFSGFTDPAPETRP